MAGPRRRPREYVTPELSACSLIPSRRRPDSTETSACPPSCAIVITFPAIRQEPLPVTMIRAASAVAPITQVGGSGWLPDTRSQSRSRTFMASWRSWRWQPAHVAGQQGVADEGDRVDQEVRAEHRGDPAPPAGQVGEDRAHERVAEERAWA